jgi:glycerol-3-phosphate dehydrogenase
MTEIQREDFRPLSSAPRSLLILGGGIVGAGIARDAALRGFEVTLVERRTVGWGTSSRSSRLIHGGIRYLEQGNIRLVRESLRERGTLLEIAPEIVRRAPFLFVLDRRSWWQWLRIGIGVTLYRWLAAGRSLGPHHPLTRRGLIEREPELSNAPLLGGALYQDARGDDLALVRANIEAARSAGARVLENTTAAVVAESDRIVATLPDGEQVLTDAMVLALGPWTDEGRAGVGLPDRHLIGGTKGIHIAFSLERLPLRHAIALRHPVDRRVMFCIPEPERDRVVVGTTDTDTDESPDALTVPESDVQYLLSAARHLFAGRDLTGDDVIDRWVGLRPLLKQSGAESSRSREHVMLTEGRVLTVAGGKLTTYRAMAEEAVDRLVEMTGARVGPCVTATAPLQASRV